VSGTLTDAHVRSDASVPIPHSQPAGSWPDVRGLRAAVLAFVVIATAAVPLFAGLGLTDLASDEAIYSYAVARTLESGEWMTPKTIPTDIPFLEKPPLKIWLVAGAMTVGLTPIDEVGMRVFDALFGMAAFGYIVAFGWRLAGPVCGAVALLVLLAFDPITFEHGLRSNNMEAALILSYCGGLYHVLRWSALNTSSRRHVHATATALYFVLGFMTKFVAAIFLPLIAVIWLIVAADGWTRLKTTWKDWLLPGVMALLLILPWFLYEWWQFGGEFWRILVGQHIYTRFTASLDPGHLEPWHFYFSQAWREFEYGDAILLVLAGVALLCRKAWNGEAQARLLLLWWLIPFVSISIGTSKLLHYAYPFVPPLALGAGLAAVTVMTTVGRALANDGRWSRRVAWIRNRAPLRMVLLVLAVAGMAMALWTLVTDRPTSLVVSGTEVFRNSSVIRPAVVAAALLLFAGHARQGARLGAVAALLLVLPWQAYEDKVQKALREERPLKRASECMARLEAAGLAGQTSVYVSDPITVAHPPFYYFRTLGPVDAGPEDWLAQTQERLQRQSPVIILEEQWPEVKQVLDAPTSSTLSGIRLPRGGILLLPGPYAACEGEILPSGGSRFPPSPPRT
jgi:4-amino-4-deoxy-L-arabinose transferase-like glycosyltransferase